MTHCYWDPDHPLNQGDNEDLVKLTTARALDEHTPTELPRGHLGFSQIGKEDERMLWLQWRWCLPDETTPRVRRIFRVGHLLEAEVIELLSRIPGVTIHDREPGTGRQFRFEYLGGHFAGSMDGCILGVPEAPKTWHVLEIKTVNTKRFAELQKQGVAAWSPEYCAQMQMYMGASGMDRALFVAYCKDSSEIYTERVKYVAMEFDGLMARAERILNRLVSPPASIYKGPDDVEAKKHGATGLVYWGKALPAPNCRNCRFAGLSSHQPGGWFCQRESRPLTIDDQRKGCPQHNFIPSLMPAGCVTVEAYADCMEYRFGSHTFWNAEANAAGLHEAVYSSQELHHLSKVGDLAGAIADPVLNMLRVECGATIEGVA